MIKRFNNCIIPVPVHRKSEKIWNEQDFLRTLIKIPAPFEISGLKFGRSARQHCGIPQSHLLLPEVVSDLVDKDDIVCLRHCQLRRVWTEHQTYRKSGNIRQNHERHVQRWGTVNYRSPLIANPLTPLDRRSVTVC
jgi:hypothetical protein